MIGGIFLFWFFDALFFTMFIKEEFGEGVDSIGDLIERDMSLGTYNCTLYIGPRTHMVNELFQFSCPTK